MVPPGGLEPPLSDYKSPSLTFDLQGHIRWSVLLTRTSQYLPRFTYKKGCIIKLNPNHQRYLYQADKLFFLSGVQLAILGQPQVLQSHASQLDLHNVVRYPGQSYVFT